MLRAFGCRGPIDGDPSLKVQNVMIGSSDINPEFSLKTHKEKSFSGYKYTGLIGSAHGIITSEGLAF
jgi:hypothetical protein